jgi:hypothetical protein
LTEHVGGITLEQLKNELVPVHIFALCEGSILETSKVLKNSHLLMQYADGIEGADEDTQDAIDNLRVQISETRTVVLKNALTKNSDVEVQIAKLLSAVDYLIDIISPEDLTAVSRALVRT